MIQWKQLFIAGLALGFLSSCQTNMLKQFAKVHAGMDKHDVVELMGSPSTTTRLHGKDRWMYVFYEDDIRYSKEVHFNAGLATYVGEPWQAEEEKRAETVDKKNDSMNQAFEAEEKQRKESAKKAYSDYEKQVRSEDKVEYMPVFTPVQ